jgi:hypothetical protein
VLEVSINMSIVARASDSSDPFSLGSRLARGVRYYNDHHRAAIFFSRLYNLYGRNWFQGSSFDSHFINNSRIRTVRIAYYGRHRLRHHLVIPLVYADYTVNSQVQATNKPLLKVCNPPRHYNRNLELYNYSRSSVTAHWLAEKCHYIKQLKTYDTV